MNTHFPPVPPAYSQNFFNTLFQTMQKRFYQVVSQDEETPHIILRSPTGKLFTVTVDDAGVIHTAPTEKRSV